MTEEDFEEEARKRGWERRERPVAGDKKNGSCFDNCFGRGGRVRKEARHSTLEPVRENEGDSTFSFHPTTQPQNKEANPLSDTSTPIGNTSAPTTTQVTPSYTPQDQTPEQTPEQTPVQTPLDTPIMTPDQTISIYDTNR